MLLIRHQIHCRTAETPADRAAVVELREKAYTASGKLAPPDVIHADAKVLLFHHGTRLVASFEIRFPDADTPLDSVDRPLGYYPAWFPKKTDTIEISKLCLDREYRGSDLIKSIYEQVHRELVRAGRASIVLSSEERLRARYRTIGFRGTGLFYRNLEIMLSTQKRFGIYGLHVGPLRWNVFLREITQRMLERGEIALSPIALFVLSFYSLFQLAATRAERAFLQRSHR